MLASCGHAFHQVCIDRHLILSARCPVCNVNVKKLLKRKAPSAGGRSRSSKGGKGSSRRHTQPDSRNAPTSASSSRPWGAEQPEQPAQAKLADEESGPDERAPRDFEIEVVVGEQTSAVPSGTARVDHDDMAVAVLVPTTSPRTAQNVSGPHQRGSLVASAQDSKATEEEGTEGSEYGAEDDDDEDDDEEEEEEEEEYMAYQRRLRAQDALARQAGSAGAPGRVAPGVLEPLTVSALFDPL
jgi:hypothetical protein